MKCLQLTLILIYLGALLFFAFHFTRTLDKMYWKSQRVNTITGVILLTVFFPFGWIAIIIGGIFDYVAPIFFDKK